MTRIGWLDLTNGVSGDMLLGALVSAGVPLAGLQDALQPLDLPITLHANTVLRVGLSATKVDVEVASAQRHSRTWRDIRLLLNKIDEPVRAKATAVFTSLAEAEAGVHGIAVDDVHFHEVGALDAIADVIAVCAGLHALNLEQLIVSPIALGSGSAHTAHGWIPVPVPAVLALAARTDVPCFGGAGDYEMATPTGVALASTLATNFGTLPAISPETVGVGAGAHDPTDHPNIVRLVIGNSCADSTVPTAAVLETNIDDMDPRLWPGVLDALLQAGAGDAWLTPIAMKKGRPAHTLCAIVSHERAAAVREAIFTHTTTIGLRETTVTKHTLEREFRRVAVAGVDIAVKLATLPDGSVINAMPEFDEVARAARTLRRPVKDVLAEAIQRATGFVKTHP